ncbi:MAG: hypothetical protein MSIBF_01115 [Candidatus Altiarchaeales archaeon IMC4]|nr:MAG: hypothetical protein MSIBF_01115 [Candidatus Altiarchaeales archaeon IMC4]
MKTNRDIEILRILENDARISEKDIATMLGASEADIKKQIERLRKEKIIKKFKTVIDWRKAGEHEVNAVIQAKVVPQERAGFERTCREISKDPRVRGVYVATGDYDLMLFVEGKNIDEISEFVTDKLAPKKEIVGTNTHIIMKVFKRDGEMFIDDEVKRLKVSL